MSNDFQEKSEEIRKTREEIKKSLKEVVEILQDVREKCRISSFWNIGKTGKDLDRIIDELNKMKGELPFPAPDIINKP